MNVDRNKYGELNYIYLPEDLFFVKFYNMLMLHENTILINTNFFLINKELQKWIVNLFLF